MKKIYIILIIGILLVGTVYAGVSISNALYTKVDVSTGSFYIINDSKTNEQIGYEFRVEDFNKNSLSPSSNYKPYTIQEMGEMISEGENSLSLNP